ncbi:MAG: RusA family crossover junction endodeoxyribonuclease [Gammaproteobacteria bacterium]|nr:RusA family crossover junction endodeoxyribonuclease [Gammaproteobacteria bacterium]
MFEDAMTKACEGIELESTELQYDISYKFGFARVTSDVDNPIKPTTDVLQNILGFNDRQVYRISAEKYVGSGPWVDVTIREYFRKDT